MQISIIMKAQQNKQTTNFFPGDEWLYFKIYSVAKNANKVLLNVITPVLTELFERKIIQKWFFIRYKDSEEHLRVRFLLNEHKDFSAVISSMRNALEPMIASKIVWKVSIDTYQRETQRYGKETIDLAESFFYVNSELVLDLLQKYPNVLDLFSACMLLTEKMLVFFEQDKKKIFLKTMQSSFYHEFEVVSSSKRALVAKFDQHRINDLSYEHFKFEEKLMLKQDKILNTLIDIYRKKSNHDEVNSLISSMIHMSVNRFFSTNQRMYEMIIYDFMVQKFNKGK